MCEPQANLGYPNIHTMNYRTEHNTMGPVQIPADKDQHTNNWLAEVIAIKSYNEGIRLATDVGDAGTMEPLKENLKEEEAHIDWIEAQLEQIKQMGIQNYLQEQTLVTKEG